MQWVFIARSWRQGTVPFLYRLLFTKFAGASYDRTKKDSRTDRDFHSLCSKCRRGVARFPARVGNPPGLGLLPRLS